MEEEADGCLFIAIYNNSSLVLRKQFPSAKERKYYGVRRRPSESNGTCMSIKEG